MKPLRSETRMIDGEETEVTIYDDGLERANNRIIHPRNGDIIRSSERGRELLDRKMTLAKQRAAAGLAEGLGLDPRTAKDGEAWQMATAILVRKFAESKNIRGMGEVYATLGRATGYLTDQDNEGAESAAVVSKLLTLLERFLPRDNVIEGKVTDESL